MWSLLYRGSLQCSALHNSFGGIAGFRIASSLGLVNRFSYLLSVSKSIAELNAKLLMLEQLRSKGYLAPEVYQAQANEISAELAKLKDVRQEKFNSKAAIMLEEIKKLKMLIFELEEPLEAFDEKLFLEIVKSIQINKEDEMSVELLGGLRFRERI